MATDIPNDLQIASEFAQQEIAAHPLTKPVESKTEPAERKNEAEIQIEEMDLDDSIDAAIAGKQKEQGYESSDLELSSDDDEQESDSSSSSDEESSEDEDQNDTKSQKKLECDDEEETFPDGIVKTAHEIVDFVVEKPEFEVTPQMSIILAGTVFQVIDNVVIVHCRPNSEFSTLDQGSLLVYENKQVMGEVFETFGPVVRPYYSVRFSDSKEIQCKVGDAVYYVPEYEKTKIVETEKLKQKKYTDASNVYDEEVGEDELEFSDDEKEMEFKRKKNREKKMKKKGINPAAQDDRPFNQYNRQQKQRQLPRDFDSALADYEGSQRHSIPPRQQQSYADLLDDYSSGSNIAPPPSSYNPQYRQQPTYHQPAYTQQQQTQQGQQSYQSPAELVSALFQSYGGQLPTNLRAPTNTPSQPKPTEPKQAANTAYSIFAEPPPPLSELEKQD